MNQMNIGLEDRLSRVRSAAEARGGKCLSIVCASKSSRVKLQCAKGHIWDARADMVVAGNWCKQCHFESRKTSSDTAQRIHAIAKAKGGQCLSAVYVSTDKVTLQCAQGHVWETTARVVLAGCWCKACHNESLKASAEDAQNTLSRIRAIAEVKGGEILSTDCKTVRDKVMLQCSHGHIWEAKVGSVFKGNWCKVCCRASQIGSLDEVRQMAAKRGGECLSAVYVNRQKKLTFRCGNGHTWEATANTIQQGSWCRQCGWAAAKTPLSEVQEIAAARGGVCLSADYVSSTSHLKFRCAQGHVFVKTASGLKRKDGNWCGLCKRDPLDDMRQAAEARGGKCLSSEYINARSALLWECSDGHQWKAMPINVYYHQTWCPLCARGKRKVTSKRKALTERLLFGKSAG